MTPTKVAGLALLAVGVAGLAYGGFTYTRSTHDARIGPIELSVRDTRTINVPVWAGVIAVVVGAGLLLVPPKK